MAGELESGTIWWDLSGPGPPLAPRPPQRRANSARLTMSPAQPTGWERLMGSFPLRTPAHFFFFPPEADITLAHSFVLFFLSGIRHN